MNSNSKTKAENSTIEEYKKQKQAYNESLKKNIKALADQNQLEAFSVFEKIRDVVPDHMISSKTGAFIQKSLESKEEFVDANYPPTMENLLPLKRENMSFISWYRIPNFFKDGKFCLFNDFHVRKQVLRDRGYSHLVDALNALSTQPCLVIRLFEYTETNKQGIYSVWLNLNGIWKEVVIDDYVPIFSYEEGGKVQFYFMNPNLEKREIWMILLQKALAKAYGGFHKLYNGNSNYVLRDLTGAPVNTESVIYISEKQKITERELKHMNDMFKKINKYLEKGYILSVIPRKPNQMEQKRNSLLQIFNKKYFLGNGIYSGHEYALISARCVRNSKGTESKLVQMRNPWINEKWEGDWSKDSDLWTEKARKELNYDPEKKGESFFWMSIKDFMGYFEHLIVCKTVPGYCYNAVKLKYPRKNFLRAVVRFHAPSKGKYTISIDQKDLHFYQDKRFKYNEVRLTLCKLENGEFNLLSHTSSQTLRNTFIRKLIDEGEYYVLIEEKCNPNNIQIENEVFKTGNEEKINAIKNWRNSVFSIYGPKSCGIKIIECEDIHVIHDYLIYEGWKNYAKQRIGNKLTDFKLTFDDAHKANLAIYLLSIPKMIIYAFKNVNDFGVDINTEIMGITNMEIVGPEGKVGFNQHFKIDEGEHDVFILRETETKEKESQTSNTSFKMKSIVGTRYYGEKEQSKNQSKVYDFLFFDKPYTSGCMVEKYPQLKIAALYDCFGNKIENKEDQLEIKVQTKSIVEAVRVDDRGATEFVVEEMNQKNNKGNQNQKQEQNLNLNKEAKKENVTQEEKKPTKQEIMLKEQEDFLKKQQEEREKLMAKKEMLLAQQKKQQELIEQQRQQQILIEQKTKLLQQQHAQQTLLEKKKLLEEQQMQQEMLQQKKILEEQNAMLEQQMKLEQHRREQEALLEQKRILEEEQKKQQILIEEQKKQERIREEQRIIDEQIKQDRIREEQRLIEEHRQRESKRTQNQSNAKNPRQTPKPSRPAQNEEDASFNTTQTQISQMDDARLAHLLALSKEEILQISNHELLNLIKYTGIDAFVNLYQADHEYLERLYSKLGQPEENPETEIETQDTEIQYHQPRNPPSTHVKHNRDSYNTRPAPKGSKQHSGMKENFNESHLSPQSYQKDFSMVDKRPAQRYQKKVSRPSFLDKPKQQDVNHNNSDYHKIEFEYNTKETNFNLQQQNIINQNFESNNDFYHGQSCKNYEIPGIGDSPNPGYLDPNELHQKSGDINTINSPKKEVIVENNRRFSPSPYANVDRRSYNHPQVPYNNNQRGYSYQQNYVPNYTSYNNNNNNHFQVVDSEKFFNTYNDDRQPNLVLEPYQEQMMKSRNNAYLLEMDYESYGDQYNTFQETPVNLEIAEPFESNFFQNPESRPDIYSQNRRYDNSHMNSTNDPRAFQAPTNFINNKRSPSSTHHPNNNNNNNNNNYRDYSRNNTIDLEDYRREDHRYGRDRSRRRRDDQHEVKRVPYTRNDASRDSYNRHSRSPLQQTFNDSRDALSSIPLNNNVNQDVRRDGRDGYYRESSGSLLKRGFNPGSKRNLADGRLHLRGSGRRIDRDFRSRDASRDRRSYNF